MSHEQRDEKRVRLEKVQEVRSKIRRGYYDRPEVLRAVVERLARAFRKAE